MPISSKEIKCKNCNMEFYITGDLVPTEKYKWFLYDLHFIRQYKKYGIYILALCQSCELFMHQAIINKLIDKNPDYRDEKGFFYCRVGFKEQEYKQVYERFGNKTVTDITNRRIIDNTKYKECTFKKLPTLFLYVFREERENELPTIKNLREDKRYESFYVLQKTDINKMRNNIVHKYAYRPSYSDILRYDELIDCIFWLGTYLDVRDSLYFLNIVIKNQ